MKITLYEVVSVFKLCIFVCTLDQQLLTQPKSMKFRNLFIGGTLKNSRVMHEPYITFSVIIYAIYIGFYLKYSGLRQNVSRDCIFLSETDGMGQLISNFSKNIYQNAIITNNIDIKLQTYLVVCSRYLW